jgi:hypothetical protein
MATGKPLQLLVLAERLSVCRLAGGEPVPDWAGGGFCSVTRTAEELSVVCQESAVPAGVQCEPGWRVLQVEGPLDFALTGVLASVAGPLAEAGVSLFAISTFDTDYVLVKDESLETAAHALRRAGHGVKTWYAD